MAYRVTFYMLLVLWMWGMTTLANKGTEPVWIAAYSLVCGYLSQTVYLRAWRPGEQTNVSVSLSVQLLVSAVVTLLIFFATLTLVYDYLSASTRSMLIAVGFYFLSYWLPALITAWRRATGE